MAWALFASNGFGDHTACSSLRCPAKRSAGGAQDASGKHDWIMQSQTADIDGKGWHGRKNAKKE
jgi:hypothetical protein